MCFKLIFNLNLNLNTASCIATLNFPYNRVQLKIYVAGYFIRKFYANSHNFSQIRNALNNCCKFDFLPLWNNSQIQTNLNLDKWSRQVASTFVNLQACKWPRILDIQSYFRLNLQACGGEIPVKRKELVGPTTTSLSSPASRQWPACRPPRCLAACPSARRASSCSKTVDLELLTIPFAIRFSKAVDLEQATVQHAQRAPAMGACSPTLVLVAQILSGQTLYSPVWLFCYWLRASFLFPRIKSSFKLLKLCKSHI